MLPKRSETYTKLAQLFGFMLFDRVRDLNDAAACKLAAIGPEARMMWLTAPLTDGSSGAIASADVAGPATGGASTPAALPTSGAGAAVSGATAPAAAAALPTGGAGAAVSDTAMPAPSRPRFCGFYLAGHSKSDAWCCL
jgi:hypothetical protein